MPHRWILAKNIWLYFGPFFPHQIKPLRQLCSQYAFALQTTSLFQPFRDANPFVTVVLGSTPKVVFWCQRYSFLLSRTRYFTNISRCKSWRFPAALSKCGLSPHAAMCWVLNKGAECSVLGTAQKFCICAGLMAFSLHFCVPGIGTAIWKPAGVLSSMCATS